MEKDIIEFLKGIEFKDYEKIILNLKSRYRGDLEKYGKRQNLILYININYFIYELFELNLDYKQYNNYSIKELIDILKNYRHYDESEIIDFLREEDKETYTKVVYEYRIFKFLKSNLTTEDNYEYGYDNVNINMLLDLLNKQTGYDFNYLKENQPKELVELDYEVLKLEKEIEFIKNKLEELNSKRREILDEL